MKKGAGRPNLGKTETIKERAVTVYVPTSNMFEEWKAEAALHGVSVSRFVYELVDNAIRKKDVCFTPREELEKQSKELQDEVKTLRERTAHAENLARESTETIAKYRKQLSEVQAAPDLRVTKKIKDLFLDREAVVLNEIPRLIGISLNDKKGMANVVDSMNFLVECEFIKENMTEGRWVVEKPLKSSKTDKTQKRR